MAVNKLNHWYDDGVYNLKRFTTGINSMQLNLDSIRVSKGGQTVLPGSRFMKDIYGGCYYYDAPEPIEFAEDEGWLLIRMTDGKPFVYRVGDQLSWGNHLGTGDYFWSVVIQSVRYKLAVSGGLGYFYCLRDFDSPRITHTRAMPHQSAMYPVPKTSRISSFALGGGDMEDFDTGALFIYLQGLFTFKVEFTPIGNNRNYRLYIGRDLYRFDIEVNSTGGPRHFSGMAYSFGHEIEIWLGHLNSNEWIPFSIDYEVV